MLHAFIRGKKRGTGVEGENLSESFSGSEDTLTATVFERLSYLPDGLLCEILFSREIWQEEMTDSREVVRFQYWPRWKAYGNSGQTEPDCVIELDGRVLIVEAKRFDFAGQQSPAQLASEWLAGHETYFDIPGKRLFLLAVGGLSDTRPETVEEIRKAVSNIISGAAGRCTGSDLRFAAIPWFGLFKITEDAIRRLGGPGLHVRRLLEDIGTGMLLHGVNVKPPAWLADLTGPVWKRDRLASLGAIKAFARLPSHHWSEFRPIIQGPEIFCKELKS